MYMWGLMELNKDFGGGGGGKFCVGKKHFYHFHFPCLTPPY